MASPCPLLGILARHDRSRCHNRNKPLSTERMRGKAATKCFRILANSSESEQPQCVGSSRRADPPPATRDPLVNTGTSPDIVLFDEFRFDRRSGGLSRRTPDGDFQPVSLGTRAVAILDLLVARTGDLISQDEIMRAVWPG